MPQTGRVFRTSYHLSPGGELLVDAYGRDVEGKRISRVISGCRPYFYVGAGEESVARSIPEVVSVEPGPLDVRSSPTVRVYARYPFDVPKLRSRFRRHYEADIFFDTRVRIDYGLRYATLPDIEPVPISQVTIPPRPVVVPRILYIDIEVSDLYGFASPDDPKNAVLSVAFADTYTNRYGIIYHGPRVDLAAVRAAFPVEIREEVRLFPVDSEANVVDSFGELLRKIEPDVVSAWNLYEYDAPYLAGRTKRLLETVRSSDMTLVYESFDVDRERYNGVYRHRGRYALGDCLAIHRKKKPKQGSHALNSVAMEKFGYGKVDRPGGVAELLRTDPARFAAYNLFDVYLLRKIDEAENLLPYWLQIVELAETDGVDYLHNSRLWDGFLLREARISGKVEAVLDSKDFAPDGQREGRAAEVFDTKTGIHPWVIALDLSGEYPSIIRTFNISPETRNPPPEVPAFVLPTGGRYRKEPPGLIPRALARIAHVRGSAKATAKSSPPGSKVREDAETLADALKYIVNSAAGIMGSQHWRMASVDMFEDVTGMARRQLNWNKSHLEDPAWLGKVLADIGGEWRGEVVLGDTDSCYVKLYRNGQPGSDFETVVRATKLLAAALNESYAEFVTSGGATQNFTSVDIEGIFAPLRTLPRAGSEESAKKRYYGSYIWRDGFDLRNEPPDSPGRLKTSGLETKRWNNAPVTKDVQTRIIGFVLRDRPIDEIERYVDSVRTEVYAGLRDEDLAIPAKMGRDFREYERSYSFGKEEGDAGYVEDSSGRRRKKPAAPPFLRAIRAYSEATGKAIRAGDEFRWFFVTAIEGPNGRDSTVREFAIPYGTTIAEARARGLSFDLDRKLLYEKTVWEPATHVEPRLAAGTTSLAEEW